MHFFRNHRYRKRNTNQSKVHWGHESAALGILGLLSPSVKVLFPVWVQLLAPGGAHSVQAHHPYRYFMVYTTDLTLAVSTLVRY